MKKAFLFLFVSLISTSIFAIELNCISNNGAAADRELKYISDQKVNFCPDRIGLGSPEEEGMTIANIVYVKKAGRFPVKCIYRDYTGTDTSCTFVSKD